MKKVTAKDLLAIQKETPLAGINEALLSGKFAPAPEKPIDPQETVIGELTPFEKAVCTARDATDNSHDAIAETNNRMVNEAEKRGEPIDMAKVKENQGMAKLYEETSRVFNDLLWISIRQRLGAPALCHDIGIREGYQIVQTPSSSSIGEMIAEGLALSLLDTLGMGLGKGHRCDICKN